MTLINKEQPLYWQLRATEDLNDRLEEYAFFLQKDLRYAASLCKNDKSCINLGMPVPKEWNIDIPEVQRAIFDRFRGNYHLDCALRGEVSLRQGLYELDSINKGARRFLPQLKNNEHNKKVEELEKLIGEEKYSSIMGLRTHNPFCLNNFTTGAMYGTIGGCFLGVRSKDCIEFLFGCAFLGFLLGGIGILAKSADHQSEYERAEYLDKKIARLFN